MVLIRRSANSKAKLKMFDQRYEDAMRVVQASEAICYAVADQ